MILLDNKFTWNENKEKAMITVCGSEDTIIDENDKRVREEYIENIFVNAEKFSEHIHIRNVVARTLRTLFDKYKPLLIILRFKRPEENEVIIFKDGKLVNYHILRHYELRELIRLDVNNNSLKVKIDQDYYNNVYTPKQVRAEVDEILHYYDYLNHIEQKSLSLTDKKIIAAYELFYGEEPKFYLNLSTAKLVNMVLALRKYGIPLNADDNNYNIMQEIADFAYKYYDFNLSDEVFDNATKNSIIKIGNIYRQNNAEQNNNFTRQLTNKNN